MNVESVLEWVHPSMAIGSYLFVILNAVITLKRGDRKHQPMTINIAWMLCLIGLVTGMIWADIAWGSFWSWDPKEIGMLLLLLSISGYILTLRSRPERRRVLLLFTTTNIIMVSITLFVSPALDSIHSDAFIL